MEIKAKSTITKYCFHPAPFFQTPIQMPDSMSKDKGCPARQTPGI